MEKLKKNKFRIPRKLKKELNKGFWLYPTMKDGLRMWANPASNQIHFTDYKKGLLENIFNNEKNI